VGTLGLISPVRKGKFLFFGGGGESNSAQYHIGRMWHCRVDVPYPRLRDWTRLQWALRS